MNSTNQKREMVRNKVRFKKTIFALCILILPLAWWAFSFIYNTSGSVILAFQQYDTKLGKYYWCGLDNFVEVVKDMTSSGGILNISLRNSFLMWSIGVFVTIPLSILVSYSIHKKVLMCGFFKIILFLPNIVSGIVWTIIYKYIIEYGVPTILGREMTSLLNLPGPDIVCLIVYSEWLSLAANMVIYTGAMSRIPPTLSEAGKLDGMSDFQEFIHIVLPLIFPTLSVVLITCVLGIFTASLPTYQFYGPRGVRDGLYTLGYYTFIKGLNQSPVEIPYVSAISFCVCLLATPIALFVRWLLEKIGPTVEY